MATEFLHGLVKGQDLVGSGIGGCQGVIQVDLYTSAAALGRPLPAGPFDKNPAHGLGCGSKEVPPAVPGLGLLAINQANIRLVDQGRGLERSR